MNSIFIVCGLLLFTPVTANYIQEFITDYLKCKNLYAATLLLCGSRRGTTETTLQSKFIRLFFRNTSDF